MTALSTATGTAQDVDRPGRTQILVLWAAFFIGFSAVLIDLAKHQIDAPWSRYSALFVILILHAALRDQGRSPARRDGVLWIAGGAALTIFAVGGGMPRLARPGVVVAAIGFGRLLGAPPIATLALGVWAIPIPHSVLRLTSPALESALLQLGGLLVSPLNLDLTLGEGVAASGASVLELHESDGGLPLVALLSGLGYYAGLRAGRAALARLAQAFGWALLAIPIQVLGLAAALGLLAAGAPQSSRVLLSHGLWMSVAAAGLIVATRKTPFAARESA